MSSWGREGAAQLGLDAEHGIEVRGRVERGELLRFAAAGEDHVPDGIDGCNVGEGTGALLQVEEVRWRRPRFQLWLRNAAGLDGHEAVRRRIRQAAEHQGVDQAEDSDTGADSKGEGEDGDGGERGIAAQVTAGVAGVVERAGKPAAGDGALGAADLAGQFIPVTELIEGLRSRFGIGSAAGEGIRVCLVELQGEFGDDFGFPLGADREGGQMFANVGAPVRHGLDLGEAGEAVECGHEFAPGAALRDEGAASGGREFVIAAAALAGFSTHLPSTSCLRSRR